MLLYTMSLSRHHLIKDYDIKILDTTVKSGNKLFAPNWGIVTGIKQGKINAEQYCDVYWDMMRKSFLNNFEGWMEYINTRKSVALACYCPSGTFCHRHELKDMFLLIAEEYNIPLTYICEIIPDTLDRVIIAEFEAEIPF